jgi:hypothetical protein
MYLESWRRVANKYLGGRLDTHKFIKQIKDWALSQDWQYHCTYGAEQCQGYGQEMYFYIIERSPSRPLNHEIHKFYSRMWSPVCTLYPKHRELKYFHSTELQITTLSL